MYTICHRLQLSGPEKENAKKEALRLSLKYSFVTPLTSMVVTKPLGEKTDVLIKPKEGETPQEWNPAPSVPFVAASHPHRHHGVPGIPGMSRRLNSPPISKRRFGFRGVGLGGEQYKCERKKHSAKLIVFSFSFSLCLTFQSTLMI